MGAGDGHEGGETVEAGLPDITGTIRLRTFNDRASIISVDTSDVINNAFTNAGLSTWSGDHYLINYTSKNPGAYENIKFSASDSNAAYGASDTVQPPAYYFYFWRRVS